MTVLIGAGLSIVGFGLWLWTVKSFLDEPGYGGFDMGTAPAFDFGWFRGTVLLTLGTALISRSLAVTAAAFFCCFFASMLIKPILVLVVKRRTAHVLTTNSDDRPPTGLKALSVAEQNLSPENTSDSVDTASEKKE